MRRLSSAVTLALVAAGCSTQSAPPPGTGAREKTREFFQAVIVRDWSAAFVLLESSSQKRINQADFARRGEKYLAALGFDAGKVHVRFCDEKDDTATAHVLLTTAGDSRKHSFRESVMLRKQDDGWRVVLPAALAR